MPFTVETGAGVSGANSYISVAAATALLSYHPNVALWTAATDGNKELALMRATDYLDVRWRWYGDALSDEQGLQWPRTKHFSGKGFVVNAGVIPEALKKATAYIAAEAISDPDLLTEMSQTGAVKQYFTEGLNVIFDPKTTEENQFMGRRFLDVELFLKNIGEFKNVVYLKDSRITEVAGN